MKTLCLTILSFLFVVAAWGQSPGNPTQINNTRYYSFKQFLGSDSAYLMAQRDTNWTPSRPAMIFRPGDSTVYYWNLRYWTAFAKAVGPTNLGIYLLKANFIDSLNNNRQQLSKVGDTVYLSFGGKVNVMPDTTTKVATINFVKNQGYITTESDPVFKGSPAFGITTININNWNSAFNNATFDSVSKKLRLFAINGAQDSLVINSVLATNFNPVSHDSTIIMAGTGKVYGDTLRVSVDTTRSGIATHNWTLGQGFIKSETDPVATAKTITMVNGSGVTIFGSPTQTLGSNPTWTFKADTGLVATLAALGDSVVNKKHWDSAFVKVKFDTSSRVLTMYDFKNDSAFVVIPKGGTQNGMVAINTIRYGDILKIYADNGASTEITINNQDSLTRAHFSDTLTYLYPLKSNPAKYIPLTALSALVPLSYVNTTGVFSIDTSGAANGVATINYVNRQGYVKVETDPVATAKTVTITAGTGITVTGASQTVGSNPAFTITGQNTTAIWNANQLQGTPVSTTPPTTNQLLQYNGTNWIGFTPTYAPGFTVTVPITYSSNVIGLDTTSAAHGMASINYVQRQGYLTANQSITVTASGDATGSGSGTTAITLPLTLAASGATAGGFTRGIVNAKGLITSATDTAYQVAGNVYVDTVSSITQLENYNKSPIINTLVVTDSLRGGIFNKVSSGFVPDSGTVFPANGGGYWVRNFTGKVLNVLWFGADRNGVVDATTPINLAIAASIKNKYYSVHIPAGRYSVSTINWNPNVPLFGDGFNSTELISNSASTMIRYDTAMYNIVSPAAIISGIYMEGNGIGTIGISLRGIFDFSFNNLFIHNFKNYGIFGKGLIYFSLKDCYLNFDSIGISLDSAHMIIPGTLTNNLNSFINCSIILNKRWGINYKNGDALSLQNCDFEVNGSGGDTTTGSIYVSQPDDTSSIMLVMNNCWIERDSGVSVFIDNPIFHNTQSIISGTRFLAPAISTGIGIKVVGTSGLTNSVTLNTSKIWGYGKTIETIGNYAYIENINSSVQSFSNANYYINLGNNQNGITTSAISADIFISRIGSPNYSVGGAPNIQFQNNTDGTASIIQETSGASQFFNLSKNAGWIENMRIDTLGQTSLYGYLNVGNSQRYPGNSTDYFSRIRVNGGIYTSGSAAGLAFGDRTDSVNTAFVWYANNNTARLFWHGLTGTGDKFTIDSSGNVNIFGDSLTINNKSYSSGATLNGGYRLLSNMGITNSVASSVPAAGINLYTSSSGIEFDNGFGINTTAATNKNTIAGFRPDLALNSSGAVSNIFSQAPVSALTATVRAFNNSNYSDIANIRIQDPYTYTQSPFTSYTGTITNWYGIYIDSLSALSLSSARITNKYAIFEAGTMPSHFQGGMQYPIRTTSVSTTVTLSDYTVINTSGTNTFTMPTAASAFITGAGQIFHFVCNAGSITTSISYINLSGTSVTTIAAGAQATIQTDGTNWRQIQ